MEGKVAVLGSTDFVLPFSALGADTFATEEAGEKVKTAAREILDGKYTLIVVAENVAKAAEAVFSAVQNKPVPCVMVVPFTTEPKGFAIESLAKVLRMATGINILENV